MGVFNVAIKLTQKDWIPILLSQGNIKYAFYYQSFCQMLIPYIVKTPYVHIALILKKALTSEINPEINEKEKYRLKSWAKTSCHCFCCKKYFPSVCIQVW